MKVIFINRYFHPDLSATSQLLSDLTFGLAKKGSEVHVITSRSHYDDPRAKLCKSEVIRRVQVHRVWTTRFGRENLVGRVLDYLTFHISAGARLRQLTQPRDIVVVKTDPPLLAVTALAIVRRRRAHLINWLQDVFPEIAIHSGFLSRRGRLTRLLIRLRNRTLRSAWLNIAISAEMKAYLIKQGIPEARIDVVPNWSDGKLVYPVLRPENPLEREWGLAGKFVVGYSGNLGRIHEIKTIREAIESFKPSSDVTFLFIGGGSAFRNLAAEKERGGLKTCMFRPYQPRERLHLSLSLPDVHLISLAPEMEGLAFASKLYGIMAAGRPLIFIGAPKSETAKLLHDASCGLGVSTGRPDELVKAILDLKANPPLRADMGRRARKYFEGRYDRSHAIERWCDLVEQRALLDTGWRSTPII